MIDLYCAVSFFTWRSLAGGSGGCGLLWDRLRRHVPHSTAPGTSQASTGNHSDVLSYRLAYSSFSEIGAAAKLAPWCLSTHGAGTTMTLLCCMQGDLAVYDPILCKAEKAAFEQMGCKVLETNNVCSL